MKRVINFQGRTGRYNVPSVLWTENEALEIGINVNKNCIGKYNALLVCGTQEKHISFKEKTVIELSPEFIKNGEFKPLFIYLELRNANTDRVIVGNDPEDDGFFIEPLVFFRAEACTSAVAWMHGVEDTFKAINEQINRFNERLNGFEGKGVELSPIKD